ncbi:MULTISPECIES: hypothetical protein [unclassified Pseudodesulfovibrio]|uniref:hypothetical protein n=1 Tax=unclassified Pseudodesulfovibrio TaxID=2661612 RepID=UPI000FEC1CA5|nr:MULTISPECIES: hypothetical protein [unclassified Pseudodesulfovibrio]MCJ2164502.1 hypothetical protein [Pseudodesulfovibrio sp. S3-i]RWU04700.1 hypothetical protein DWB63_08090 [Pseudodesulfovibrio sp. S3]
MYRNFVLISITLALLTACGASGISRMQQNTPMFYTKSPTKTAATVSTSNTPATMTPQELQAAVMAFADTTNTRMAEAAAKLEEIGTPQARITAARMLVFNLASNVEIAAGPYPGVALLDLIVVVSLRRMVWEDFWVPKVFGEPAKPIVGIFREVEKEVWELAAKIMDQEQMDELARVILLWRKNNPDKVAVNYVRFEDFGELGLKPSMEKLKAPGGLFASVETAAEVAQDIKIAIDRAFYLMSRMQIALNFQAKLAYLEIMFQPEMNGLITQTDKAVGLAERYAEIAENLPREFNVVSSNLMNEMFVRLDHQRTETLNQALAGMNTWQNAIVTDVMTNVSQERKAALDQALEGIGLQQEALFKHAEELMEQSEQKLENTLEYAFVLGLLLILAFFLGLSLYKVLVVRPLQKSARQG